ncbi:hypothetical protein BC830DRAFT_785509 [Chytriomyces sp. MP71]|nr:hypothetical protein BC830DRAFT_785509 [Chytriomyces sp. MP71]
MAPPLIVGILDPRSPVSPSSVTVLTPTSMPLAQQFIRACSNGDADSVVSLIESGGVAVDGKDGDGVPPLVHAACWGHSEVARVLVERGADVEATDAKGWTSLIWAVTNGHEDIAALLLKHGARKEARSRSGKSLWELSKYAPNKASVTPLLGENPDEDSGVHSGDEEPGTDSGNQLEDPLHEDDGEFDNELELPSIAFDWKKCRLDQMLVFPVNDFSQVLALAVSDLRRRVDASDGAIPSVLAANVIFLCARFAHYMNTPEVLHSFFDEAVAVIQREVECNSENVQILSLWISNCHHLVYYLKRDEGLRSASFQYQAHFSEILTDSYERLVICLRKALIPLAEGSLISYISPETVSKTQMESILGMFSGSGKRNNGIMRRTQGILSSVGLSVPAIPPPSTLASQKSGFFSNRNRRTSALPSPKSGTPPAQLNPGSLMKFLSTMRDVLRDSNMHFSITHQLFKQLFRNLNAELFNRIITSSELVSRSRAMQIGANLQLVLDWLQDYEEFEFATLSLSRKSASPTLGAPATPVSKHFSALSITSSTASQPPASLPYADLARELFPTRDALAFIARVTGADSLFDYLSLKGKEGASLSTPQVRRLLSAYHFEVGEAGFAPDVEDFFVSEWIEYQRQLKARGNGSELGEDEDEEQRTKKKMEADGLLDPSEVKPLQVPTFNAFAEDLDSVWRVSGMQMEPVVPTEVLELMDNL